MAFRKKMSRSSSKRSFRRGARKVHKKNFNSGSSRGGIRL